MPELCRFYGIVIRMYFNDHGPPHFHADYGGDQAVIGIETLAVLSGRRPRVHRGSSSSGPFATRTSCALHGHAPGA